jgi:hypothetical protein
MPNTSLLWEGLSGAQAVAWVLGECLRNSPPYTSPLGLVSSILI